MTKQHHIAEHGRAGMGMNLGFLPLEPKHIITVPQSYEGQEEHR